MYRPYPLTTVIYRATNPLKTVINRTTNPLTAIINRPTNPFTAIINRPTNPFTAVINIPTNPLTEVINRLTNPLTEVIYRATNPLKAVINRLTNPLQRGHQQTDKPFNSGHQQTDKSSDSGHQQIDKPSDIGNQQTDKSSDIGNQQTDKPSDIGNQQTDKPFTSVINRLTNPLTSVINRLTNPLKAVNNRLTNPFTTVINVPTNSLTAVINRLTNPLTAVINRLTNPFTAVINRPTNPLTAVNNSPTNSLTAVNIRLTNSLTAVINVPTNSFTAVINQLTNPLTAVINKLTNPLTSRSSTDRQTLLQRFNSGHHQTDKSSDSGHQQIDKPFYSGHQRTNKPFYSGHQQTYKPFNSGYQQTDKPFKSGHQQTDKSFDIGNQQIDKPFYNGHQQTDKPFYSGHQRTNKHFNSSHQQTDKPFNSGHQQTDKSSDNGHQQNDKPFYSGHQQTDKPFNSGHQQTDKSFNSGHQQTDKSFDIGNQQTDKPFYSGHQQNNKPFNTGHQQTYKPFNSAVINILTNSFTAAINRPRNPFTAAINRPTNPLTVVINRPTHSLTAAINRPRNPLTAVTNRPTNSDSVDNVDVNDDGADEEEEDGADEDEGDAYEDRTKEISEDYDDNYDEDESDELKQTEPNAPLKCATYRKLLFDTSAINKPLNGNSTGPQRPTLMEYTRVPLILSDESDEDIFVKGYAHYGDLELKLLPPNNGMKPSSPQHRKHKKKRFLTRCQIISVAVTVLLVIFVSLGIFAAIHSHSSHDSQQATSGQLGNSNQTVTSGKLGNNDHTVTSGHKTKNGNQIKNKKPTENWSKTFDKLLDSMSESNVRLLDVDGDGLDDVIFATVSSEIALALMRLDGNETQMRNLCLEKGEEYPCVGHLYALRGYDGKVLWREKVYSSITLINCADFDVDKDGYKDCILCGRPAGVQAVSTKTGKTLWVGDKTLMSPMWNTFQVLALPDFDGDGVSEVLVPNGGDPSKDAEDHDRAAGRLLILSGATGQTMGSRYLAMPDSRETYFSPVMYTCVDGSQYILFGSGGETVTGDLMMISLPDFYRYVMEMDGDVPGVQGRYDQWLEETRDPTTGIITLYKGTTKGVMVPPVIVDVDDDGVLDIMASIYDGKNILYNGKDLSIMWSVDFPGQESYSTPAPGHFDDDGTLDFMTHWSLGQWPVYNKSQAVILSGKTGGVIWKFDTDWYEMSSDLTLLTDDPHRDMFLFKLKGRGANVHMGKDEILIRTGELHNPHQHDDTNHAQRRHLGQDGHQSGNITPSGIVAKDDYRHHHIVCEEKSNLKTELFLMDRTITNQPIKVMEVPAQSYTYTVRREKDSLSSENQTMCVVLIPEDRATAAVGDVDGDGQLDVISIVDLVGPIVDAGYSYTEMKSLTVIQKISLAPLLGDVSQRVSLNPASITDQHQEWTGQLLPMDKQNWGGYMGTKGNSIYRGHN
ncbi:uncharacterized protein LOC110467366 [Mizuhopecten yessoensis]|uniref:uncharacterized protein LOC110467366 n=1 Tax=Mizuhopecten yessoensis TaxID=6573 RepID=UPI000B45BF81|nr:uncharacterized protein LOC110467366 [Mizuhopecten yessoensis]